MDDMKGGTMQRIIYTVIAVILLGATASLAEDDMIHAYVDVKKGKLRIVSDPDSCKSPTDLAHENSPCYTSAGLLRAVQRRDPVSLGNVNFPPGDPER